MTIRPSTFTDWLRTRSDGELRALCTARPDLITPVPADLEALAGRASAQPSVTRALGGLDRFTLQVVEALIVLPEPAGREQLREAVGTGEEPLRAAVERLRELALVRDAGGSLHLVEAARQAVHTPAGLGPPAETALRSYSPQRLVRMRDDLGLVAGDDEPGSEPGDEPTAGDQAASAASELAAHVTAPRHLPELLEGAGTDALAALDRLTWGPPAGRVDDAHRTVTTATARSPVERLLARGLLVATDEHTVVLPREVALHLRGGRVVPEPEPEPPPLDRREHDPELVASTAAGQAFTTCRAVAELLELWGTESPPVLRSGGLGVRELRRAARELDVEEWVAALYVEVAAAAGLLAATDSVDGEWLPTKAFDAWVAHSTQRRWTALAVAWRDTTRLPGLVGERDERDRAINALGPGLDRTSASGVRRRALDVVAQEPHGCAPSSEAVLDRLNWCRPRGGGAPRDRMVGWTLREAEVLGVTGRGALPDHGRALLDGDESAVEAALEPLLPELIDHVLIQADLTAVAPGPLLPELGRELALAADVESTGGATVYRFTDGSLRRAMDAGRSAGGLLELLERHSRTELPQPLRYLIDDVARRHGRLRVGAASSYVRCDDEATLNSILSERRAAPLRLRRLAPTVLASQSSREELLEGLRAMGYAPAAESPHGEVVVSHPNSRRAERSPESVRQAPETPAPDETIVAAAVRALRAGDEAATSARSPVETPDGAPPRSATATTLATLRQATGSGRRLWIGYLDAQGRASSRIVEPVRVEGGFLTAYDATRAAVHRFALHRITGISEVDG